MRGSESRHRARTMSCDLWGSESHDTGCSSSDGGSSGSSSSLSLSSLSSLSGWLWLLGPKVPKSLLTDEALDELEEDVVDQHGEAGPGYPGISL